MLYRSLFGRGFVGLGGCVSGIGRGLVGSGFGRASGVAGADGWTGEDVDGEVDAPAGVDAQVAPATSRMDVASMFGKFVLEERSPGFASLSGLMLPVTSTRLPTSIFNCASSSFITLYMRPLVNPAVAPAGPGVDELEGAMDASARM